VEGLRDAHPTHLQTILDEWAGADGSAAGDETMSDARILEDAASHQSSDDGLYSVHHSTSREAERTT
jgi:hypothetical protein